MVGPNYDARVDRRPPSDVFLQISGASSEVPVIIRSLSGGLVTLEVLKSLPRMNPETLNGTAASLHLANARSEEKINIRGTLVLLRFPGGDKGKSSLSLKLANPDQMTRKALENLIPHGTADIKNLWERWDQAKINQDGVFGRKKIYSLLLWALAGLTFKLAVPKSYDFFGDLMLFLCSLMGAIKTISLLRKDRVSKF